MIGKVTKMMLTKTMPMLTKMMGEVGVQMARGVKAAAWNVNRRQCCAAVTLHTVCAPYTHTETLHILYEHYIHTDTLHTLHTCNSR